MSRRTQRHATVRTTGIFDDDRFTYAVGQKVVTCDSYPGRITARQAGGLPGQESYTVELEDGLGGGEYRVGDITPVLPEDNFKEGRRYSQTPLVCDKCGRTATTSMSGGLDGHTMLCPECKASTRTAARADLPLAPVGSVHTAEDDYPELSGILWERPDHVEALSTGVRTLGRKTAAQQTVTMYRGVPAYLSGTTKRDYLAACRAGSLHVVADILMGVLAEHSQSKDRWWDYSGDSHDADEAGRWWIDKPMEAWEFGGGAGVEDPNVLPVRVVMRAQIDASLVSHGFAHLPAGTPLLIDQVQATVVGPQDRRPKDIMYDPSALRTLPIQPIRTTARTTERTTALSLEAVISVAEQTMERTGNAGATIHVPVHKFGGGPLEDAKIRPFVERVEAMAKLAGYMDPINAYTHDYSLNQAGHAQAMVDRNRFPVALVVRPVTNEMTVLHEIAHLVRGSNEGNGHDAEFARTLHQIYARQLGQEAADVFWGIVGEYVDGTAKTATTIRDQIEDPNSPWWFRKITGPAAERANNALPPNYKMDDIQNTRGDNNWCRFRRDSHCLSGETEIMTIDGMVPIKALAGSTATVLDGDGNWTDAPIRSFGEQQLFEVVIERWGERRSVFATSEHRWFITVAGKRHEALTMPIADIEPIHARQKHALSAIDIEAMTAHCDVCQESVSVIMRHGKPRCSRFVVQGNRASEKRNDGGLRYRALKAGDSLAVAMPRKYKHGWSIDPVGVMAGFVYGDGWTTETGGGNASSPRGASSAVRLWGEKDAALLPYFSQYEPNRRFDPGEMCALSGVQFGSLPGFFNRLPDLNESPHFLYGWLAGYFAADGCVGGSGQVSLTSANRQALDHVIKVCNRLNIAVGEIKENETPSSVLVPSGGVSFSLHFFGQSLSSDFFLIPAHRERFDSRVERAAPLAWRVVEVKETDRFEEVFCATVPTTASFALPGYILTGNCFFPKELDARATAVAGYDVWVPVDRGTCHRRRFDVQAECEISEPGPKSGDPNWKPDATRRWDQGGQRVSVRMSAKNFETGRWFHGTNARLSPGEQIVPGLGAVHGDENDRVWVASNAWVASAYGSITYEVTPSDAPKKRSKAGEFFCDGATVLREVPTDEIRTSGNEWWALTSKSGARDTPLVVTSREGVEIHDNNHADSAFDPDGGRWTCYCVKHDMLINVDTLDMARYLSHNPDEFCEVHASPDEWEHDGVGWMPKDNTGYRTAAWKDVRDKGVNIRRNGGVHIIANTGLTVTAEVQGEHGLYVCTITRVPGRKQQGLWRCSCKWNQYAWARSEQWKRLEGRQCSHVYALLMEMQAQEMFGGTIEEENGQPMWREMEPILESPMREADPTPRELALALENAMGSLHLAMTLTEDHGTQERIAQLLEPAGVAYPRRAGAAGHQQGARVGRAFPGKVRGRVTTVEVTPAGVMADGQLVNESEVLYPTWDPRIGLEAMGSKADNDVAAALTNDYSKLPVAYASIIEAALGSTIAGLAITAADDEIELPTEGFDFAGLIIKSYDSGRILMTQRSPFHGDDEKARGKWEFPGGHLEDGETPFEGALREFTEETGLPLPEKWKIVGYHEAGKYLAIVIAVDNETWTSDAVLLDFETMGIGWFHPDEIEGSEMVRGEIQSTDFDMVREASKTASGSESFRASQIAVGDVVAVVHTTYPGSADIKDGLSLVRPSSSTAIPSSWSETHYKGSPLYNPYDISVDWAVVASVTKERGDVTVVLEDGRKLNLSSNMAGIRRTAKMAGRSDHKLEDEILHFESATAPGTGVDEGELCSVCGYWRATVGPYCEACAPGEQIESEAILHDAPEPALPAAYGSEDDEDPTRPFVPGDARLGHLSGGGGDGNEDIAAAATAFLQKQAVKVFSPAEQQMIIDEGSKEHLGASNVDRLDLTGTFYELSTSGDDPIGFW